jgi:hypothetical protein
MYSKVAMKCAWVDNINSYQTYARDCHELCKQSKQRHYMCCASIALRVKSVKRSCTRVFIEPINLKEP